MAQVLPLTAMQVMLNRDLGLESRPEAINRYFAVEFSMNMLKPVFAALSDLCPVMGRRRGPYMVAGGAAYAAVLQAYARVTTLEGLYAAGITSVVFYALCETGADGMLVQLAGGCPKRAMQLQATGSLMRSAGSFTAAVISIPLLMGVSARAVISLAGLPSLAAAAAACYISEPKVSSGWNEGPILDDEARGGHFLFDGRQVSSDGGLPLDDRCQLSGGDGLSFDGEAHGGLSSNRFRRLGATRAISVGCGGGGEGRRQGVWRGVWAGVLRGVKALRPCFTRRMGCASMFLFAYRLMPTAYVTFTTFTYAQFTLPNWAYSGLLLASMAAGIAATIAYRQLSTRVSLSHSFVAGVVGNAVCGLGRLWVVHEYVVHEGGDKAQGRAPAAALVSSTLLSSFGLTFGYMPILALAAQCAPPGLEAFGYSVLIFTANLGTSCGAALSAELTKGLGLGAGAARSWNNLGAFIWICAVVKLAPVVMLPLIEGEDSGGAGGGSGEGGTLNPKP
jgi:hypothetical protein